MDLESSSEGTMLHASTPLTPAQVYRYALDYFQPHLKFHDTKTVSASMLWTILVAAAGWMTSLSDACKRLRKVPDDHAVAAALCATLPTYDRLQRQVHAALTGHLPRALRRRPQILALDLTLLPAIPGGVQ
jgi:hypothetical protein